jgi:hypothetical protein
MDFLNEHLTAIIIALIGVVGISLAIRIQIKKSKNNNNRSVQRGNTAGGNISGRDTIIGKEKNDGE